ncbi:hypothetical protein RP75_28795 [Agrobacterium arsenijevicii]|uniref:Uncharacterized protein n=1 Tax=Agrobacterium arsenijevicii TaxID=1585697 RepID=A0ABR5CYW7_9HYPH|nr:hypothetical protein RP75_28795 [Agrobacterium arsenijevicii]
MCRETTGGPIVCRLFAGAVARRGGHERCHPAFGKDVEQLPAQSSGLLRSKPVATWSKAAFRAAWRQERRALRKAWPRLLQTAMRPASSATPPRSIASS